MANNTWVMKQGAEGKVFTGVLSDANGPVDLTSKTVTLYARKRKTSEKVIDGLSVTKTDAPNGEISFTVTSGVAAIAPDTYLLEFKVVEGSSVDYFPTKEDGTRTYGKLVVQSNLD